MFHARKGRIYLTLLISKKIIIKKHIHHAIKNQNFLFGNTYLKYADCNLNTDLVLALETNGKIFSTSIQTKVFPHIMDGTDIVIGAETGSGKTLAYLIPLINKCMNLPRKSDMLDIQYLDIDKPFLNRLGYPEVVILVPNKELVNQVYNVGKEIIENLPNNENNVKIDFTSGISHFWPYRISNVPNILVCTPSFLSNFVKGPRITEEDLFKHIKCLVLDEADMLLQGSYLSDIEKIQSAFKLKRREMSNEIEISESEVQKILVAATLPSYGLGSIVKYIEKKFPNAKTISNDYFHKHHPCISQIFYNVNGTSALDLERLRFIISILREDPITAIVKANFENGNTTTTTATNNNNNNNNNIDKQNINITAKGEKTSTMIFVNTAATCANLAKMLRESGILCVEFHKNLSSKEKQNELSQFRDGLVTIMVCTDSASRGLDLPNVGHVVQAEFALNVVQYLHRVGRCSRAGVFGKATNFVDKFSNELVDSILSDTLSNKNIEDSIELDYENRLDQSFSRRRGFRQKIKKNIKNSSKI